MNGRYLMSKYSNDGHKLNHEILSPCTKELVRKNLASFTRIACLIKVSDQVGKISLSLTLREKCVPYKCLFCAV